MHDPEFVDTMEDNISYAKSLPPQAHSVADIAALMVIGEQLKRIADLIESASKG